MARSRASAKGKSARPLALALLAAIALGLALGAVQAVSLDQARMQELVGALSAQYDAASRSGLFVGAVLKSGGHLLLIWLVAFLPLGEIVSAAVLFAKAMGYGFTAATLSRAQEMSGFLYPGPSLLFSAAIVLGFGALLCSIGARHKRITGEYSLLLLTAESCAVLAALL
ncbi:MAG: hypothetical protein LBC41_05175 [Clostridiales bacterium]|nr:hypothetical protein [Clostridiales bacterium]